MTDAPTVETAGTRPTLAQRAEDALLALSTMATQRRSEAEEAAITAASDRAEKAAAALDQIADAAAEFRLRSVAHTLPSLPPTAGRAVANLRTAATKVRDSDQDEDLTARLKSAGVQDALKAAETLVKACETALRKATDVERLRLAEGSQGSVTSLPGRERLQTTATRIQTILRQPAGANVVELPGAIDRWRAAANEWKQVIEELDTAVSELPPDIKAFVEAAASEHGAVWSLMTPDVRVWLDTGGNGDGYVMRKW